MIGIGQMAGWAFGALWRRRGMVSALAAGWLVIDGLLIGYLKIYHPTFGSAYLLWLRDNLGDSLFVSISYGFFIYILPELFGDAVRAVFVVLLLRTLLNPSLETSSSAAAGQRRSIGLIGPILLIFLFEILWTALLFPPNFARWQMVANRSIDIIANPMLLPLISAGLFVVYSLAMSKLCFVYPNAALGTGLQLLRSWRQTEGLAIRLFVLFVVIPLPLMILSELMSVLLFSSGITAESVRYKVLARDVLGLVALIVENVLTLAVIAVAYTVATGRPTAAIPDAAGTSEPLARAFE